MPGTLPRELTDEDLLGTPPGPAGPGPSALDAVPDASALPEMKTGASSDLGLLPSIEATAKRLWSSDPHSLAESLKSVKGITISYDQKGEPLAVIGGKPYSLNTKGFSLQDVVPLATALVTNIGGMELFGRAGAGPKLAGASGGGLTGAVMATGEALSKGEKPDLMGLAKETAIGTLSGLVGTVLGSRFGAMLQRAGRAIDNAGNFTRTAIQAIREQGVDPSTYTAAERQQIDGLLRSRTASPDIIRRAASEVDTGATGIPLTRGEASGNPTVRGHEVAVEEGLRGDTGAQIIKGFKNERHLGAIPQAAENVAGAVAPAATLGLNAAGAGQAVEQGLGAARNTARTATQNAYDAYTQAARAANIAVPTASVPATAGPASLLGRIQTALQPFGTINDTLAPRTADALRHIEGLMAHPVATPDTLEGIRKVINNHYMAATSSDRAALLQVRRAYDSWMTDEVTQATQGSPVGAAVMQSLQNARATARSAFERFTQAPRGDPHGKFIENILDGNIREEEIVNTLMGGATQFTSRGADVYARLQSALGRNDPILDEVRRQAILRITGGSTNQQALDARGAQAMAQSIRAALTGDGARYSNMILGTQGVDMLNALERQLRRMVRPDMLGNSSRSAFMIARRANSIWRKLVGTSAGVAVGAGAGALVGGPFGATIGGAAGGYLGDQFAKSLVEGSSAKLATTAVTPFRGSPATAAVASQLKALPGRAIAATLPPLSTVGGFGILDLLNKDKER